MTIHARHIFDWDDVRGGQYFTVFAGALAGIPGNLLSLTTYFANLTAGEATARMSPILDEMRSHNLTVTGETASTDLPNNFMFQADASLGINDILGSRLIPATAYKVNPDAIGQGYQAMMEQGVLE